MKYGIRWSHESGGHDCWWTGEAFSGNLKNVKAYDTMGSVLRAVSRYPTGYDWERCEIVTLKPPDPQPCWNVRSLVGGHII